MQVFGATVSAAEMVRFGAGGAILGIVLLTPILEPLTGPLGILGQVGSAALGALIVLFLRFRVLAD